MVHNHKNLHLSRRVRGVSKAVEQIAVDFDRVVMPVLRVVNVYQEQKDCCDEGECEGEGEGARVVSDVSNPNRLCIIKLQSRYRIETDF